MLDLVTKDSEAFHLLSVIAIRADRETGEAKIGDWDSMGVTSRQTYRSALKRLIATNKVTTKSTNKGTVAKLVNTGVYDINQIEANQQPNQQPNQQAPEKPTTKLTTNKKFKELFIQEVKEMGVCPDDLESWLSFRGKKNTERALNSQLKILDELITQGFAAKQIINVVASKPWVGISKKQYFIDELTGEKPDVKQQITDTSWAGRDQCDLQATEPDLQRLSESKV